MPTDAAHPAASLKPYVGVRLQAIARGMAGLFSTHPPMEERIAHLQAMARDYRGAPPQQPPATSVRSGGSVPQTGRRPWG